MDACPNFLNKHPGLHLLYLRNLHIPSLVWNHSVVWQVSISNQVCCIDVSSPNPKASPFDVESESMKYT